MSGAVFARRAKRQAGLISSDPLSSVVGSALGGVGLGPVTPPPTSSPVASSQPSQSQSETSIISTSNASTSSLSTDDTKSTASSSSSTSVAGASQTTSRTTASSTDSLTNVPSRTSEDTSSPSATSGLTSATSNASSSSVTTPSPSQSSQSVIQSDPGPQSSSDQTSSTTLFVTETSTSATSISTTTPSLNANNSTAPSFFQNKALAGGVFAGVGVLLLVLIGVLVCMRQRRRSVDIEFPPDPFKPDTNFPARSPTLPQRYSGRDYEDVQYDPGPSPPAQFEEVPLSLRSGHRRGPSAEPPMMTQGQWGNLSLQPPQPPPPVPYYPQDFEAGLLRVDPYAQPTTQPSNVALPESPSDTGHSQHSTAVGSEAHLMRNASLPASESAATGASGASSLARGTTSSSYSRQLDPYMPPLPARPTLPDTFGSEQTLGIGDEDDYSRPRQLKIANQ